MVMTIVDTYNEIIKIFSTLAFDLETWKKYSLTISPSLQEQVHKDASKYDFNKDILPVIKNALSNRSKLEVLHTNFLQVTKSLDKEIFNKFNINLDLDIILYLGLCNGAGWFTKLDNRRVVLLGIEKILELGWEDITSLRALLYHELGHVWHDIQRDGSDMDNRSSIFQLYQEGIAMVFEQTMYDDTNYFHQYKDDWLDWCLNNEGEIKKEFLRRIQSKDSTQDFFGDWCNYKGYSDVGYFLGAQFIRYLLKKYTLTEIAKMKIPDINIQFSDYVESIYLHEHS
ncbi:MAG TPA: hypothetical protein P5059_04005 [Candidatus Dojkabacteria bacterium]|nr:hypothetical protein [Candidatus Dojkabacteria bacterium]